MIKIEIDTELKQKIIFFGKKKNFNDNKENLKVCLQESMKQIENMLLIEIMIFLLKLKTDFLKEKKKKLEEEEKEKEKEKQKNTKKKKISIIKKNSMFVSTKTPKEILKRITESNYLRSCFEESLSKTNSLSNWFFWLDVSFLIKNKLNEKSTLIGIKDLSKKYLVPKAPQNVIFLLFYLFIFFSIFTFFTFLCIYFFIFLFFFLFFFQKVNIDGSLKIKIIEYTEDKGVEQKESFIVHLKTAKKQVEMMMLFQLKQFELKINELDRDRTTLISTPRISQSHNNIRTKRLSFIQKIGRTLSSVFHDKEKKNSSQEEKNPNFEDELKK